MSHRKVFISILGTSNYGPCKYTQGDFTSSETHFIQEATLEFLNVKETWTAQDIAYIFLTPTARTSNWQERPVYKGGEEKGYIGLGPILNEMQLPCPIKTVDITEDGDEQGLWSVFQTIYDELQEGDELYIDITHSFRYLPMLLLVLCNYAKFLKQTKVVHISYGNYEAKAPVKPLVDLMPLVEVQDWTFAASDFLRNGRTASFTALVKERIQPILKATKGQDEDARALRLFLNRLEPLSQSLTSVRGKAIIDGGIFRDLNDSAQNLKNTLIPAMAPLIDKIKDSFSDFAPTPNIENGFVAAQWCYDKQLYQQSITILQETLKGYTAEQAGYPCDEQRYQDLAAAAYNITVKKRPEREWKLGENNDDQEDFNRRKVIVKRMLSLPLVQELCGLYDEISQLRNDFNHAGIRPNPMSDIPTQIERKMVRLFEALKDDKLTSAPPLFLNLSNHSSDKWGEAQLDAAKAYGKVVDMPFPEIDPGATTEEIYILAEEYAEEITSRYPDRDLTVHIMGEMTFCFRLVTLLHARGVRCVASTTQRKTSELEGGKKESIFEFQEFREY
ncbi:TIGR02221 family CRISPR-associated protein [Porphyromonas uenonis]|uniref:TIGR02221 family CRISPR-associated protein n=1 Tax=Porphyromonas uenonis TaxID=281920 RepID=UPI00046FAAC9|nr:TIGR02221 family CRISPR-associated protein [Porphyromonas uenonis]